MPADRRRPRARAARASDRNLGPRAKRLLLRLALVCFAVWMLMTAAINGLVRWVSGSGPWLFDPRYNGPKARALFAYAEHRPLCFLLGEADVLASARAAAVRHGVDPDLFAALVQVESGMRPHRISATGAMGPAQLVASTARRLGVRDAYDPAQATEGGACYLREQLDRFHGNQSLALAAYNAGPGAVHGSVPVNGETELYVPRVLATYRALRVARLHQEARAHGKGAPPSSAPPQPPRRRRRR